MKLKLYIVASFAAILGLNSCKKYLDIIPDNIATIDQAFNMRATAERFLFSCYSYLPKSSNITESPALTAADEIWLHDYFIQPGWEIARGNQNIVDPYLNFWQGNRSGKDLFQAIRDCNIFLENIGRVPDMDEFEKNRWVAEVKFLKAYYHFYLVRMYGPIPLKKVNVPINASEEEMKAFRDPVDDCFQYIESLLDEAAPALPLTILAEATELGRITRPVALSLKAYVLVTAASPLFNGNPDYAHFKDKRGTLLFNPQVDDQKWERAKIAAQQALAVCAEAGNALYYYNQSSKQYPVSPEIRTQMNIRNSFNEKWNREIIWGNSQSLTDNLQIEATPRGLDPALRAAQVVRGKAAVPLKITELFYTKNGVPIQEDQHWHYNTRFQLKQGTQENRYYIKTGYTTALMNYDREPRYYASLGFDGGIWYGQGSYDDTTTWYLSAKKGDAASNIATNSTNITGIWPKKYVNYVNVIQQSSYTRETYPWPEMRLSNLMLLCAEAMNEANGPSNEVYELLDAVRARAGLAGVLESWATYSSIPDKPRNKEGLRAIIQGERTIELIFEGQRFWDLRRWKKAADELNKPIQGWDIEQKTAEAYYRPRLLYQQTFSNKNYLWPIKENEILANRNTIQNPGW